MHKQKKTFWVDVWSYWDKDNKWMHRHYKGFPKGTSKSEVKKELDKLRKKYGKGIFTMKQSPDGHGWQIYQKKYTMNRNEVKNRFGV
jgi:hypothetical protein